MLHKSRTRRMLRSAPARTALRPLHRPHQPPSNHTRLSTTTAISPPRRTGPHPSSTPERARRGQSTAAATAPYVPLFSMSLERLNWLICSTQSTKTSSKPRLQLRTSQEKCRTSTAECAGSGNRRVVCQFIIVHRTRPGGCLLCLLDSFIGLR